MRRPSRVLKARVYPEINCVFARLTETQRLSPLGFENRVPSFPPGRAHQLSHGVLIFDVKIVSEPQKRIGDVSSVRSASILSSICGHYVLNTAPCVGSLSTRMYPPLW